MSESGELLEIDQDVERLRKQVRELLSAARHNESVHNRFQSIEFALLAAQDFAAISSYLRGDFRALADLDAVCLALADDGDIIRNILGTQPDDERCGGILLLNRMSSIERLLGFGHAPVLASYDEYQHGWLFDAPPQGPGSVALLPLIRRDSIIGCLAMFSKRLDRYQPGAATEFLQRLSIIAAICVENCLHYEQLRRLSFTDALTGLSNRRELERRMGIEVSRTLREGKPLSCLYLDVDYFKQVNDTHGHDVGDQVLQAVSDIMMHAVRLGDVVARYGGEEFVIMLPGADNRVAMETAERVRKTILNTPVEVSTGNKILITISIGLASFMPVKSSIGDAAEISEQILNKADKALMRAKQLGRNRVVAD
ncbi:MAG: DUF484 family protein [Gammaproteobacteria bacterium]